MSRLLVVKIKGKAQIYVNKKGVSLLYLRTLKPWVKMVENYELHDAVEYVNIIDFFILNTVA